MGARWSTTGDPQRFLAAAGQFLAAHRVELTVATSIVHSLLEHGSDLFGDQPPLLAWYHEAPSRADAGGGVEGSTSAIAIQTPPHQMVVSALTEQAAALLAAHRGRPHRVLADIDTAGRLARAWGARSRIHVHERLHRLGTLIEPRVPGRARIAVNAEAPLVWFWYQSFHEEVLPDSPPPRRARIDAAVTARRVLLHLIDRRPVALAAVTHPHLGLSRIGPVYTPPEHRGRGYAAAATAAAARTALQRGAEQVLLFTDLANPTSNALYARLGFSGVLDVVEADLLVQHPRAE